MPDFSSIQLSYRPDLDVLTVRWAADSPLAGIRADYEAVLAAGQTHHTARWLLDVRRRVQLSAEVLGWVTHDWLPRAAVALAPARPRIAYLITPARERAFLSDSATQPDMRHIQDPTRPYDLRLFNDEGDAIRWLTS